MNTQTTSVVEQKVLQMMQAKAAFTSLDISNGLKAERYPVRHGEVAAAVRDIFQSGAMGYYDYDRRVIAVVTDGGAKQTQTFLYLHAKTREREYTRRDQSALPPVPANEARDLPDDLGTSPRLSRPPRPCRARTVRRDGALAVRRGLLQRLGWAEGTTLAVVCTDGQMEIAPQVSVQGKQEWAVRVWSGLRVRVCKRKLHRAQLLADQVTVEIQADGSLCLMQKGH